MGLVYIYNVLFIPLACLNLLGTSQLQINESLFTTVIDGVFTMCPLHGVTHLTIRTTLLIGSYIPHFTEKGTEVLRG